MDRSKLRHRRHKEEGREKLARASLWPRTNSLITETSFDLSTDKSETDLPTTETMPVCTVLEKRNGVLVGAELTCSVREENKAQRESYSADWHCVSLKTQPQDR